MTTPPERIVSVAAHDGSSDYTERLIDLAHVAGVDVWATRTAAAGSSGFRVMFPDGTGLGLLCTKPAAEEFVAKWRAYVAWTMHPQIDARTFHVTEGALNPGTNLDAATRRIAQLENDLDRAHGAITDCRRALRTIPSGRSARRGGDGP